MIPTWVRNVAWAITLLFVAATCLITILDLVGVVPIDAGYRKILQSALLVELIGAFVAVLRTSGREDYRVVRCETDQKIQDFLAEFIARGNEISIFSNTFGWVTPEIRELLRAKSQRGNVALYVPKNNDHVQQIAVKSKISVHDYANLNLIPPVRFTLLDRNQTGSRQLAVGQGARGGDFRISVFTERDNPQIVTIAAFLTDVIERSKPVRTGPAKSS